MQLSSLLVLSALSLTAPATATESLDDVMPIHLVLTHHEEVILSEAMYVTDTAAELRVGTQNGYPVRTCTATRQTLTSVPLFAGWHVRVQRDAAGIQVHLVQYEVKTGHADADARGCVPLTAQTREAVTLHATLSPTATGVQRQELAAGFAVQVKLGPALAQ